MNEQFSIGDLIICENFACGFDVRFLIVLRKIKCNKILESVLTLVSASNKAKESCSIERFPVKVFTNDEIIKA